MSAKLSDRIWDKQELDARYLTRRKAANQGIDYANLDNLPDLTQYLRADGAQPLVGNLAVDFGITIDGVDLNVHAHTGADGSVQVGHADIANILADQHHAGFIGLEDNAAVAIDPAADDRIQITDDGVVNADRVGNTLALSIAQAQIDHGSIGGLADIADHLYALLITGARPLTGDWDIGAGRRIEAEEIRARSNSGLKLFEDGGTGIFVEDATGRIGMGTLSPFDDVASAGDFNGTGLHIKGMGSTRLIVEGDDASFTLVDTGGGVDDRIMYCSVNTGVLTFLSTNDDLTVRVNSILVMNMGTGFVGLGTSTAGSRLAVVGLPIFAVNAAAIAGGLAAGDFYRTGGDPDLVCVVH